jgi:outer membrane receptor for ferrienterochelin and colicins
MASSWRTTLLFAILPLCAGGAAAQQVDEDELALSYGDATLVTIATGSSQAIARAPATATVITAADIRAMGANEFEQVLAAVPGLHVSVSHIAYSPIYSFRGSFTNYNPQVLMLVNGLPITSVFAGNRSFAWGGMPVENIARIEVLRGPGSALYGADAYSGVINVITNSAADVQGLEFGVRAGSFNTRDTWLQYGGTAGPFKAAFYLRAGASDGQRRSIAADLQSSLDPLFGTHASRAPGPVSLSRTALDARSDLSYGALRWRAGVQKRRIGFGAGLAESLDPDSRSSETRWYTDLSYDKTNLLPHWDINATLAYQDLRLPPGDPAYLLFPRGAFGGAFPDGVVGNPGHSERTTTVALSLFYTGIDSHRIRVGLGHRRADLYAVPEFKNFDLVAVPGVGPVFMPLGPVIEATRIPSLAYITPHLRHLNYAYLQDEWTLARDWRLTAGVRHDHYSDVGATTNPRLALVWDAAYNVVLKAMHGRAFRAPSFTELYTRNNPVNTGNTAVQPETIATSELALAWQPMATLHTSLTLFRYRMHDIIAATTNPDASTGKTFRNTGDQTGHGLELEASWNPTRMLRVAGSLSLQRSTDQASGKDAGLAPQQRAFVRADWRFDPAWLAGAVVNRVAKRAREASDVRAPIADYTGCDLTLQRDKLFGKWELRAAVQNVFNADIREPSIAPGNIPHDLPLAPRAFSVQLRRAM